MFVGDVGAGVADLAPLAQPRQGVGLVFGGAAEDEQPGAGGAQQVGGDLGPYTPPRRSPGAVTSQGPQRRRVRSVSVREAVRTAKRYGAESCCSEVEAQQETNLTGTPAQLQQLRALQAHLAFAQGRFEDAALLSRSVLSEEDLRLPYRDRVRLSVLDGRLAIRAGRVEEGVAALQQLARRATQSGHGDLAAHVWQVLATTLAAGLRPSGEAPCRTRPGRPDGPQSVGRQGIRTGGADGVAESGAKP